MAVHTRLTKREISNILSVYRIGNLLNFSGIQEGIENTNYKIKTTNNYYILTIFEERVNKKNLPFFLNLMLNCSKKKICCPKPILDTSGKLTNNFKKKGIANIGYRPTFNRSSLLLEVNIFGIKKNLYTKVLEVKFLKFIREEKKFVDIYDLKKQIQKDIKKAKK